jgi:putative tryptophan/tyrosine transport system permease protein
VNLLIGAVTIGLLLAPLAFGVFVGYRVYNTLDLTVDGSFGLGAAVVAALLVHEAPPVPATMVATVAGVGAGIVTGLLHTRLLVSALLAGVLTSTALYSVNLFLMQGGNVSLTSSETVMTAAERLGRRFLALPESVTLFGTSVSVSRLAELALMVLLAGGLALALGLFLRTDLGMAMRASGTNPQMAKSLGIDVDRMVVAGLALSNGCVALAGALFAQYEGFANIQMGVGAIVMGIAMLLVGETLFGRSTLTRSLAGVVAGTVVYRLIVAGAIRAGLSPNALKLVTAGLVLAVLVLPRLGRRVRRARVMGGVEGGV